MGTELSAADLQRVAKGRKKEVSVEQCETLAAWTASSPMANDGGGNGPVPIIFTPDAAATRANLVSHPDRLTTGKKRLK